MRARDAARKGSVVRGEVREPGGWANRKGAASEPTAGGRWGMGGRLVYEARVGVWGGRGGGFSSRRVPRGADL